MLFEAFEILALVTILTVLTTEGLPGFVRFPIAFAIAVLVWREDRAPTADRGHAPRPGDKLEVSEDFLAV
ncbi:MAG TPA: hypothetical protein VNI01_05170 [Elusimicrobiota bacterium]|nr:hypothetical protein [Elusimicrobiota bacterium]